jgi:hypothetical protein
MCYPRASGPGMYKAVWILQYTILVVFYIGTSIWAGTSLEVHVYLSIYDHLKDDHLQFMSF